jgi:hypothetical protein
MVFCVSSHLFGSRMVRIFAGYTIEQDELLSFLKAQKLYDDKPEEVPSTVTETWMDFIGWRTSKLHEGDSDPPLPWVQCV